MTSISIIETHIQLRDLNLVELRTEQIPLGKETDWLFKILIL